MTDTQQPHQEAVERTLDAKIGELLALTAQQAAHRVRKRTWWVMGVLLVLVLGGLISLQVQFNLAQSDKNKVLTSRCQERNRQQNAVKGFAASMAAVEATNQFVNADVRQQRQKAYDQLAAAYGAKLDCTVYVR